MIINQRERKVKLGPAGKFLRGDRPPQSKLRWVNGEWYYERECMAAINITGNASY